MPDRGKNDQSCMAAKPVKPFVLALFDWSTGALVLRFMKRSSWGGPMPGEITTDPREAYSWQSRQAAHQYLRRSEHLSSKWEVLDLRRVGWKI